MTVYYNEHDPFAAEWLRNLIREGLIAPGDVDERDIRDIQPSDLAGYAQCHFFAGIGGWSYALRLAGWPDERPVWTGSCPCQPFSAAGQRGGFADERHLWPAFFHLIEERRPPVVFGEQVASKDGLAWLDLVQADLEGAGYAVGAADLCAAGVGAPHIRQRLWWWCGSLDVTARQRHEQRELGNEAGTKRPSSGTQPIEFEDKGCRRPNTADACSNGRLAHVDGRHSGAERQQRSGQHGQQPQDGGAGLLEHAPSEQMGIPRRARLAGSAAGELGDAASDGRQQRRAESDGRSVVGAWADADWLPCRDGKARPVEPGTFPLAYGIPGRVGRLRAYGNAIVPQVAAEFIRACGVENRERKE